MGIKYDREGSTAFKMGGKVNKPMNYSPENIISTKTTIEAKIVLLGDSGVGKSSIAQRYCKNAFSDNYDVTIGGAYMQK